jgi:hypothetical protein
LGSSRKATPPDSDGQTAITFCSNASRRAGLSSLPVRGAFQTRIFHSTHSHRCQSSPSLRHHLLQPNKRAGRKKIARISANEAPTVMPTRRNGRETSQMNGSSTRKRIASGQHNAARMNQPMTRIRNLIALQPLLPNVILLSNLPLHQNRSIIK